MKKKILISSIVTILLLSMSLLVLTACNDEEEPLPESRPVIIEVINPNTGEVLKENDHIDLPPEKTASKFVSRTKRQKNILQTVICPKI